MIERDDAGDSPASEQTDKPVAAPADGTQPPMGSDYVSDRKFSDFPLSNDVLAGIHDLGFEVATPVQAASIEPALAGKDLVVRAKTGTGKTAAFCIPMLEKLEPHKGVQAIILEPTRELAQQTAEQATVIAAHKNSGIALLVGGMPMGPQEKALNGGASLVVGTPGRILDHLRRKNLSLEECRAVCLDEADEMLSMGFFQDVTSIMDATHAERQVLLFSATVSEDTGRIISRYLSDPEEIMLSSDTDGVSLIEHLLYETLPKVHKVRSLLYLLDVENPTSAIIFCNTREDTATVATFLDRQGLDVQLLSGELSQNRRSAVMKKVKNGEVRFLVSTDVAARGIDISDLSHVINYSLPQDPSIYLHRTGRTGRIGKRGTAISLVGGTDIGTKRMLVARHGISFIERLLPDSETCTRQRVDRQAAQIRAAMGTMVFESYLPTVRAIMERDDREMLFAAALRAFFRWDRTRRATAAGLDSVSSLRSERREKSEGRRQKREHRGDRNRDESRGRRSGEGRDRQSRRDGKGSKKERGRKRDRDSRERTDTTDFDALLLEEPAGSAARPEPSARSEEEPKGKRKKGERGKKKERRSKKSAASDDEANTASAPPSADVTDIDALLDMD